MVNEINDTPREADVSGGPESNSQSEERTQRLEDFRKESLSSPNPLAASLGMLNADLMALARQFHVAIDEATRETPTTLEELSMVMPFFDPLLRIVKQIDRLTQLGIKLDK